MKATVSDDCTACGLCEETCPEVFRVGDADKAQVIADPVPPEAEDACREAADGCPLDAILLQE